MLNIEYKAGVIQKQANALNDSMGLGLPFIPWVKNDPKKFKFFTDGGVFLVALQVKNNKTGVSRWEFDVVEFDCDVEGASLYYRGKPEAYDSWAWEDFEFFALLEGDMPTAGFGSVE